MGAHLFKKLILGRRPIFAYRWFISQTVLTLIIVMVAAVLEVYVSLSG
jgi:hypothetical protein